MGNFNQNYEAELVQVKSVLILANIALLVAVLDLSLHCVCQCSARTQNLRKTIVQNWAVSPALVTFLHF